MKVVRYLFFGSLFIGILVTFVDRGLLDNFRMKDRLIILKKVNTNLARENKELERNISLLRDNLSYIERVARNELGMVKNGDLVLQFEK